jgi:hypothetical protein
LSCASAGVAANKAPAMIRVCESRIGILLLMAVYSSKLEGW